MRPLNYVAASTSGCDLVVVSKSGMMASAIGNLFGGAVCDAIPLDAVSGERGLLPAVAVVVACADQSLVDDVKSTRDTWPAAPIVALAPFHRRQDIAAVVAAGALGVVSTGSSVEALREAVARVRDGIRFACAEVSRLLISSFMAVDSWSGKPGIEASAPARLTARERAVLKAVCEGHVDRETAAALGISESTVRSHRDNIMKKLGVRGVAQLVRVAIEHELV